jgi:hypothetical protein
MRMFLVDGGKQTGNFAGSFSDDGLQGVEW